MSQADVEAAYPLSPMQQGMLFHSLVDQGAGFDIEQMVCSLHEPIDAAALRRAWDLVAARHAILRTGFRWQDLDEPRQEVRTSLAIPLEERDLRLASPGELDAQIKAFLKADRLRGFNLAEPPLVRVTLFTLGPSEHIMVWTFHHALLDGRSFPLILNEVFAAHDAYRAGSDPVSPPLPRPYRDYIDWLQLLDIGKSQAFFREALKGFSVPTPLPAAKPAAEGQAVDYADQDIKIPEATTSRLYALARQNQITINTLVQGAFSILLARYSSETDVVFGATRACRRSALAGDGTDTMVGIFINTLPLRVEVPPERPILPWLKDLRARWFALRDHEHTPLVKIREASEIPQGSQLFDALFVFEDYLLDTALRAQGGSFERRGFRLYEQTNFPLTLAGYGGPFLTLRFEYDRRRFEDAAIGRMLGHLSVLLTAIADNPDRTLAELPMLTDAERHAILVEANATKLDFPRDRCIHHLFEAQAQRTPEAIALSCQGKTISYRDLDRRTNQVARVLQRRGVGPDVLVGVCMERSIDLIVALIGVLKAGGAYVPLDPLYPKARIAAIIEGADAPHLITQEHLVASLPDHKASILRIDADAAEIEKESADPVTSEVRPSNLAYVIFTSGSTGKPKGVAIEHHSTVAFVAWARTVFSDEELRGVLFSTSVCFDLSIYEMFVPLAFGGTVIIAPNALHLPNLPESTSVTLVNTVPTAIAELVQMGGIPASVRTVNLAGEPLLNSLAQQIYAVPTVEKVYNLYGPTEDTTYSTYTLVQKGQTSQVTIGKIMANSQSYVLDARREPVPVGVAGELYLGGEGLARGYYRRPDLTAERFVQSPFSADPADRLYRTGDLVRLREDGEMDYFGRIDHQVKVRGFRIELGEIEAVLAEAPGVRECVAVVREDTPGDKRIVAYVAPGGDAAALRDHVKQRLPEYMVPAAFVSLPRLPLTPNGKIDRKALPAPDDRHSAPRERAYVAPSGQMEEAIAELFAKVLRLPVEKVSAADSFFELGGHSLLAVRLFAQIERMFGKRLNLATIFAAPTVSALADVLRKERGASAVIEITPRGASKRPPLFWCGQAYREVVLLGQHLGPDQPMYSLESSFYSVKDPSSHITDFAARYVEEVLAVEPEGPYLLGGFCLDAFIALEIALELQDRGKRVALLALVERDGPDPRYTRVNRVVSTLAYHKRQLDKLSLSERAGYLFERIQRAAARVTSRIAGNGEGAAEEPAAMAYDAATDIDYNAFLSRMARSAVLRYAPRRPYEGRAAVFFAEETMRYLPSWIFPKVGWDKTMIGELEIQLIPGDHDSIVLDPAAALLARQLRRSLDEAARAVGDRA